MIDVIINVTLLAFLAITAVAIVRMTNLFAIIMMFSMFSFLSAGLFIVMDAVDVAFTEAAVGAGISTVLMLATLALTKDQKENHPPIAHRPWLPLTVVIITGSALIYGTWDIAPFGAADAPAQTHVAPGYLERSIPETGVQNVVTSVLASYRGFDTLGEVTVVFTAGIAVLLLIGGRRQTRNQEPKKGEQDDS